VNKSAYFLLVAGIGSALILTCFLLPDQVTQPLRKETLEARPGPAHGGQAGHLLQPDGQQAQDARPSPGRSRRSCAQQVAELTVQNQVLADKDDENNAAARNARLPRPPPRTPARLPRGQPRTLQLVETGAGQRRLAGRSRNIGQGPAGRFSPGRRRQDGRMSRVRDRCDPDGESRTAASPPRSRARTTRASSRARAI
jgi:hypothetical protein